MPGGGTSYLTKPTPKQDAEWTLKFIMQVAAKKTKELLIKRSDELFGANFPHINYLNHLQKIETHSGIRVAHMSDLTNAKLAMHRDYNVNQEGQWRSLILLPKGLYVFSRDITDYPVLDTEQEASHEQYIVFSERALTAIEEILGK